MNEKDLEERIETLNPGKSRGSIMTRTKYDAVKKSMRSCLKGRPETLETMRDCVIKKLEEKFDGRVGWYVDAIKIDLEARGIIKRQIGTRPQLIEWIGEKATS